MSLESRLRKIEPKAERRHVECVLSEVSARLHGAGPDCCQVFAIHVAPDILADRRGDATALASLQEDERWLAEQEAAEPGFTNRVESELRRLGLLETGDVAMAGAAGARG